MTTCTLCPKGTYSAAMSASSKDTCTVCQTGTYSANTGASACSFARLVNIRKKEGKTNAPLAEEVSIKMRLGKVHASVAKRVLSPQVRGVPTAPHVHHVPLGSMEIRVELSRAQIATPESWREGWWDGF